MVEGKNHERARIKGMRKKRPFTSRQLSVRLSQLFPSDLIEIVVMVVNLLPEFSTHNKSATIVGLTSICSLGLCNIYVRCEWYYHKYFEYFFFTRISIFIVRRPFFQSFNSELHIQLQVPVIFSTPRYAQFDLYYAKKLPSS